MDTMEAGAEYPWMVKGVTYNGNLKWVAMNAQTGQESPEFHHYKAAQLWVSALAIPTTLDRDLNFTQKGESLIELAVVIFVSALLIMGALHGTFRLDMPLGSAAEFASRQLGLDLEVMSETNYDSGKQKPLTACDPVQFGALLQHAFPESTSVATVLACPSRGAKASCLVQDALYGTAAVVHPVCTGAGA